MKLPTISFPTMEPSCEYSGPDFKVAQERARKAGGFIYENNKWPGEFLVLTPEQQIKMWPLGVPAEWMTY